MKLKFKHLILVIIIILNVYLLHKIFHIFSNSGDSSEFYNEIIQYTYIFVFSVTWLYDNINFIFIRVQKLRVFVANPSVYWSLEYTFDTENLRDNQLNIIFDNLYDKYKGDVNLQYLQDYEMKVSIKKFFDVIFYINDKGTSYTMTIKTFCTTSYRDSLNLTFERFDELITVLQSEISRPTESWYSLNIMFDEYNPFYVVITKAIESIHLLEFDLSYTIDSLQIRTYNQTMEIISENYNDIKRAAMKYIAISTKELFK